MATALGLSGSLVTQWARGKPIGGRCVPVRRATAGAVRRWAVERLAPHLARADWRRGARQMHRPLTTGSAMPGERIRNSGARSGALRERPPQLPAAGAS